MKLDNVGAVRYSLNLVSKQVGRSRSLRSPHNGRQPGSLISFPALLSGMLIGSILFGNSPSLAQLLDLPPASPPAESPNPPTPPTLPTTDQAPETKEPETVEAIEISETGFIREQTACPQDFDTLSNLLVRDIPSYTNRILQSSVGDIATAYRPAYVITASQPDQMPLEIRDRVYTTQADISQQTYQLFFTTLERQYSGLDATSIQHFHWLFLVPSDAGWQMAFMFSAIGDQESVLLPPRDSSQGSIGQAVQRWLKDCHANAVVIE
ncbi:MAG: hypothetical protein AAF821_25255 [Cyanobacteria bacterium P01_D01_bin.156]